MTVAKLLELRSINVAEVSRPIWPGMVVRALLFSLRVKRVVAAPSWVEMVPLNEL
jgi:hypothetical protein